MSLHFSPRLLFVAILAILFFHLSFVPLHLPYEGKCQNNGRPEMTDRRRHVRR